MTRIQMGLVLPTGPRNELDRDAYLEAINKAVQTVDGHFDSIWFVDHLQFGANSLLEGWTALTYFSALYPQFRFGHAVICQSFRNPALLAKMGATLQFLTRGRFILGIGAGWKEDEYLSYGYPFPSATRRVEELDEALQIVKAMWTQEQATFEGRYYQVRQAWCEPKPEPLPPIMVGAMKPKMLRLAARHADWWNVSWIPIDEYRTIVEECERACEEFGRDPATLARSWFGGCACGRTDKEIEELLGRPIGEKERGMVGTPSQLTNYMSQYVELGVNYFMLGGSGFPKLTTLELLVSEVLPALNGK